MHAALLDEPIKCSFPLASQRTVVHPATRQASTLSQPVHRALPEVELVQIVVRSRPQRAARRAPFVRDLQRNYRAREGRGERAGWGVGAGGGWIQGARGAQGPAADAVVLAGGEEEVLGGVGGDALWM